MKTIRENLTIRGCGKLDDILHLINLSIEAAKVKQKLRYLFPVSSNTSNEEIVVLQDILGSLDREIMYMFDNVLVFMEDVHAAYLLASRIHEAGGTYLVDKYYKHLKNKQNFCREKYDHDSEAEKILINILEQVREW